MSIENFNGERLKAARTIRCLSSTELAKLIDVSKQAMWQFESKGKVQPKPENLFMLAQKLNFPTSFFLEDDWKDIYSGSCFYRAGSSITKKQKEAQKELNIIRGKIYSFLDEHIEFPSLNLFQLSKEDNLNDESIEKFAEDARNYYGMEDLPIGNMINFMENNGILLSQFLLPDVKFDAVSQLVGVGDLAKIAITPYNGSIPSFARLQFTLAHELGHWLLGHMNSDEDSLSTEDYKDNEHDANLFASSFLLPRDAFLKDLPSNPSLYVFVELKKKWRVSIQAMIYRTHSLGEINYNQYQYLMKQVSKNGWRTHEPLDDEFIIPKPTLLRKAIEMLIDQSVLNKKDLLDNLKLYCGSLNIDMYEELAGLTKGYLNITTNSEPTILLKK
ncbi:helix-turn-helix domain-containing protein [Clostridium sp.]|uniref:helix-turn-helix domain-containing protein n=1 Tax=Clostridium sp. TaxID=1506 RepID=UPI003D6D1563